MFPLLHLVDHRHGVILNRDAALPFRIHQQLIFPKPEVSCSLAGDMVSSSWWTIVF